jgi:hypothetical protein
MPSSAQSSNEVEVYEAVNSISAAAVGSFYAQAVPSETYGGIAIDASGNTYLIADARILVFPAGATGLTVPTRIITGSNTQLTGAGAGGYVGLIAVDAAGNIYAKPGGDGYPVLEFAAGANGNVAPIRYFPTKQGGAVNTGLDEAGALAVDSHGYLYVTALVADHTTSSTGVAIAIFSPSQNGDVVPAREIYGPHTGFYEDPTAGTFKQLNLALDTSDNIYAVVSTGVLGDSIVEFAAGANGDTTPLRTISGASTTFLNLELFGVCLDTSGNLYLNTRNNSLISGATAVIEFTPTASGDVAPVMTFRSQTGGVQVPTPVQMACH